LEDDLKYAIEVEGKMSVADIANYDQVKLTERHLCQVAVLACLIEAS
jgi:hypothetical protein